jgi:hypothetical protein
MSIYGIPVNSWVPSFGTADWGSAQRVTSLSGVAAGSPLGQPAATANVGISVPRAGLQAQGAPGVLPWGQAGLNQNGLNQGGVGTTYNGPGGANTNFGIDPNFLNQPAASSFNLGPLLEFAAGLKLPTQTGPIPSTLGIAPGLLGAPWTGAVGTPFDRVLNVKF